MPNDVPDIDLTKTIQEVVGAANAAALQGGAANLTYKELLQLNGWVFPGQQGLPQSIRSLTLDEILSIASALEGRHGGNDKRKYNMLRVTACCTCV